MKKKSFAVLGLGKFGSSVAEEMARAGVDVLAVDMEEENVHNVVDMVTCAMKVDVRDSETLASLGLSNMDGVIVAITESLDASIMATITAKEAGVPLVVAKAKNDIHAKILKRVGADRIIVPEKESGTRMARCLVSGNFIDFIALSDQVSMVEIGVKSDWVGKGLRELSLRDKIGANVIALHSGDEMIVNIHPDAPLKEGDTLWVVASKKEIDKL